MKKIFFLSIFLFYIFPSKSLLQNLETEKLITINDGLSQNSALAIIQDRKGFIWIGTKDGLNRYDGIGFKVYRHSPDKNSLINNHIKCLYQDSEGNIWIGTYGGLSKFNPETEQFISYQKNDSTGLCDNIITAILEDRGKNIWIGTNKGLNKIITSTDAALRGNNKLIGVSKGSEPFKELYKKSIYCLYEDNEKNIWVGTRSNGLYRLSAEGETINRFPIDAFQLEGGKINFISSITELSAGEMLVGTFGKGAFTFDKQKKKFFPSTPRTKEQVKGFGYVTQIHNSANGCYMLTNRTFYKITNGKDVVLWQNHIVTAPTTFLIDNSGIVWIGSDGGGIVKLVPFMKKFNTITKENYAQNGFNFSSIRAILKVKGNLLIGGYTGLQEAKNYHSGELSFWKNVKQFNGINVYSMALDPIDQNVLWIGTEGSGLFKYNLKSGTCEKYSSNTHAGKYYFLSNTIFDILVCRNDDIYFATGSGTVKYNYKKKSFTNIIYNPDDANTINSGNVIALCEDKFGNIWMGIENSGISVFNPQTNSFKQFEVGENKKNSSLLSDNKVNIIFEDSKKNIWIGTACGLSKYSFEKNNFTVYKTKDGLPNDCIYGILEDKTGSLWLSTNKGISKFDPHKNSFVNYDESYGLQSNEFNTAAYYKGNDGEMFFGGIKGFTSFYPDEIFQNSFAPQVVITNFKKFNQLAKLDKSISYMDKIVLPYNYYFFSFDFVMPSYSNPLRHMFAYKLSGLDERWITLTNGERTAAFTAIPAGEYTLVVKGANCDGVWSNQETKLKIIIQPAYWNTWWFRSIAVGIIFTIVFWLFSSRVNRLKREKEIQKDLTKKLINSQEEERKNISSELHDDLGQNLLVLKNRLMLADRDKSYEEHINSVLEILDGSIQDVSNISHLLHPSELEELGLSQAIESMIYRIKSASNLKIINNLLPLDEYFSSDEKMNVFRIIQEALNNILKHANATEVILAGETKGKKLIISVSDNGLGFADSNLAQKEIRPHIGLKGMRERALMLKGILLIDSALNKGTKIIIEFNNKAKK